MLPLAPRSRRFIAPDRPGRSRTSVSRLSAAYSPVELQAGAHSSPRGSRTLLAALKGRCPAARRPGRRRAGIAVRYKRRGPVACDTGPRSTSMEDGTRRGVRSSGDTSGAGSPIDRRGYRLRDVPVGDCSNPNAWCPRLNRAILLCGRSRAVPIVRGPWTRRTPFGRRRSRGCSRPRLDFSRESAARGDLEGLDDRDSLAGAAGGRLVHGAGGATGRSGPGPDGDPLPGPPFRRAGLRARADLLGADLRGVRPATGRRSTADGPRGVEDGPLAPAVAASPGEARELLVGSPLDAPLGAALPVRGEPRVARCPGCGRKAGGPRDPALRAR